MVASPWVVWRTGFLPLRIEAARPIAMTCLCLVIQPAGSFTDADLPASFDKLGIKPLYASRLPFVLGLLAEMRFDVLLVDDAESHESALARLAALVEFETPVLLLRRAFSERQELEFLQAGADEVIDRSASTQLIALKIAKAAKGRPGASAQGRTTLRVGPLELNPRRFQASVEDVPLTLTRRQFELLFSLALEAGQFVHRSVLEGGTRPRCSSRGIDMQISRIRKCLRAATDSSLVIHSVYRYGYCLTVRGEEPAVEVACRQSPQGVRMAHRLAVDSA